MASLITLADGRRQIQFTDEQGKRRTVHLGRTAPREAGRFKDKVEQLLLANKTGMPLDDDAALWLSKLPLAVAEKLAAVGLIPKRQAATLRPFLEGYIAERSDVKPSTKTVYGHTKRNLLEFFGDEKLIREITPGAADQWRLYLQGDQGLADNTIRRRSGIAKQFFRAALRRKLIAENPFTDLAQAVRENTSRYYFVSVAEAAKVIEACPDLQWRLLFALSRWGGLRCPSEHLGLCWDHIDWARDRMTVHSPKTEHHEGGESRVVPLFPELRPYLEAGWTAWQESDCDSNFVITMRRDATTNLRTRFKKIIKRAGLKPWPKLFQNLRSTRETELTEKYPLHVVCAWLGNSPTVATKHYLQVTEEHYRQGAGVAQQNALQQGAADARREPRGEGVEDGEHAKRGRWRDNATTGELVASGLVGDEGLETPHNSTEKQGVASAGAAECAASETAADLSQLTAQLRKLSPADRKTLLDALGKLPG